MAAKLSVNLNAIAMLRNRRGLPWPSVTALGRIALEAGASGLTVHPRPDQRHIRFSDLGPIRALIDGSFSEAEFNMEGYPEEGFLKLVEEHRPEQVTLVPDDPAQATSDHGWDFRKDREMLGNVVARIKRLGLRVSLFADGEPDREALKIAKEVGADRIELYTGPYGGCFDDPARAAELVESLGQTADIARDLGLDVNAGHDLTVANLPALVARIPALAEVSIGHGLTADALEYGMAETVRRFRRAGGQDV
jgi:pyridoxine 5-phosphate synthase